MGNFHYRKDDTMSDLNSKYNKHMSLDDRIEIQSCLDHGMTFKAIAKRISKDPTTISKEVKKHLRLKPISVTSLNIDTDLEHNSICPLLLKAPFVCNGCKKRSIRCGFQKRLYQAKSAQVEYRTLLSEAREGIPLNKEEFYEMDAIITDGIKKGQHLYHIMQSNSLSVSKSTVYRHLHKGYLSVSAIDLPRVVKFKPRHAHLSQFIPKSLKVGRTYDDFCCYTNESDISYWVEMDTVIGETGGKVILTFDFTFCNFMFGLLLDNKSADSVTRQICSLKHTLVENGFVFGDIFPVILTDNGGEFANINAIENDLSGDQECKLFFCDPYKSSQKPRVEKNHTMFRDIVPKGESFEIFTQETVNLIFSHVNSVKRKSLNGKTPFEMFEFTYGSKLANILGIVEIPAQEVIQSPALLKK